MSDSEFDQEQERLRVEQCKEWEQESLRCKEKLESGNPENVDYKELFRKYLNQQNLLFNEDPNEYTADEWAALHEVAKDWKPNPVETNEGYCIKRGY